MSETRLNLTASRARRTSHARPQLPARRRVVRVEVHGVEPASAESVRRVIEAMRRARAMLHAGRSEAEECLGVALDRLIDRASSELRPRHRKT